MIEEEGQIGYGANPVPLHRYDHIAAALLLTPDVPAGTISLSGDGRPIVDYALTAEQKKRFRDAIVAAARIYLAAGAREVVVPVQPPITIRSEADLKRVDAVSFAPATAPLISAHQQWWPGLRSRWPPLRQQLLLR